MGEGGGPTHSEGTREQQDGEREKICREVCPGLAGFFGCALPAPSRPQRFACDAGGSARRASLRLRMTTLF